MDLSKSLGFALLVLILIKTCIAFEKVLERVKLDGHDTHDIDMYIEQKLSYVHAKVDLEPTITGIVTLEKCIYKLEKGNANQMSVILANNLNRRLERISSKVTSIVGKSTSRKQRSIEILGNLISDLFGNPGPADWKKNNANLLIMQSAIKKLNDETLVEHTDIDTNRHLIEVQNNELRQVSTLVTNNMVKLGSQDEELTSLKIYFEIMTLAEAVESQVDALVEIKVEGMKGFCSEKAINRDFLIENLQTMESNRVGLGPVFGSWEWREYFKNAVCSLALVDGAVWVTVRIPIVRKSEKLSRVIPSPMLKAVLDKVESYGIRAELFKEKDNDKYHVISKTSMDFCNKLGNTMTCGVRNVKFTADLGCVVPVEFSHNRLLLVSTKSVSVKIMEKCPNGLREYAIDTDTVLLVPNNCSYVSNSIAVDVRESDMSITKEIGMIHFEKIEFVKVNNRQDNITKTQENITRTQGDLTKALASKVANTSLNHVKYLQMHSDIEKQLNELDFKHDSLWSTYRHERLILVGVLCSLLVGLVLIKIILKYRKRKQVAVRSNVKDRVEGIVSEQHLDIELPELKIDKRQQQQQLEPQIHQQQQQQQQQLQQQLHKTDTENVYTEIEGSSSISFSSPKERSQFYSK